MDAKRTLQQQMQALHGTLEAAILDCPADALTRKLPGSTINSIGAIDAHTVFSEDGLLNGLVRGGTPVYFAGGWEEADRLLTKGHRELKPYLRMTPDPSR